jgi:hypothetical protein
MAEVVDPHDTFGQSLRSQLPSHDLVTQGDDHRESEQAVAMQLDEVAAARVFLHVTDGSPPAFELQPA